MSDQAQTRQMPRQQSNQPKHVAVPSAPPGVRKKGVLELIGLVELPLAGMAAVDQVRNGDETAVSPYAMDIMAIEMHKDTIADAVVELGDAYPVLGAILDKVSQSTPFGALFMTVMTLGIQIAENHGALPETSRGLSPSLIPRDDMAKVVLAQQKQSENGSAPS